MDHIWNQQVKKARQALAGIDEGEGQLYFNLPVLDQIWSDMCYGQ